MFTVNRDEVSASVVAQRQRDYERADAYRSPEGRRYALCLHDPVDLITLVTYLRGRGASVLLMHGETPMDTAMAQATEGGCCGLVFREPSQFIPIRGDLPLEPDAAVLQYSSGTTGRPKLIRRSWTEIGAEMAAYNEAIAADPSETPVVLAAVTHSYGLICGVLASLARGSRPVVVTQKNPKAALGIIRDTPNHLVYGVPLLLHVVTGFAPQDFRFHKLMSSGAPMPEALFDRLRSSSHTLLQQYGCSEAGCISLSNNMQSNRDAGLPLAHVTVTTEGTASEPSEIVVVTAKGTISTGDLGSRGEDGHLYLHARMDDVINVAGLKVFPGEVEDLLSRLPGVTEAVVYRGRHPVMGEQVKAKMVADGVTADEARAWCTLHLPPYKVPANIECVSEIPKSPGGKISRKLLEMGDAAR